MTASSFIAPTALSVSEYCCCCDCVSIIHFIQFGQAAKLEGIGAIRRRLRRNNASAIRPSPKHVAWQLVRQIDVPSKNSWIGVTPHPTAQWLARQITEAFPWDSAPTYLLRDNDGAHGEVFTRRL